MNNNIFGCFSLPFFAKNFRTLIYAKIGMALFLLSFASQAEELKAVQLDEVKNIIDSRCTICHGCYDAPCQLKLSAYEGLTRGATSQTIYSFMRLENEQPTRLFIDAHSVDAWRELGFHSVLENTTNAKKSTNKNAKDESLLSTFLTQKEHFNINDGDRLPNDFPLDINRELSCPTKSEVGPFLAKNPLYGMPYGMAALPAGEQHTLQSWVNSGAPDFDKASTMSSSLKDQIENWEVFFNRDSARQRLVSRYLYEHLFLGQLIFENEDKITQFRLIRSTTSSGKIALEIPTTHPNDPPGSEDFYYRIVPIDSTLVDKTQFTYLLDSARLERWQDLFFKSKWQATSKTDYSAKYASNPFLAFQDIPASARYQFLLDNTHYFISNFIKGPVCRGQVALNVINDYFFVAFLSPEFDLSVVEPNYLTDGLNLLDLPKKDAVMTDIVSVWHERLIEHEKYLKYRDNSYRNHALTRNGFPMEAIWQGDKQQTSLLTVFRHFDSASVMKGFIGNSPKNAWVIDYPTMERIYYDLVVNFDVFGNVSHQMLSRLYMDYLRMESEALFLSFLPLEERKKQLARWYRGILAQAKIFYSHSSLLFTAPTKVNFMTKSFTNEFLTKINQRASPINESKIKPQKESVVQRTLQKLNGVQASASPWLRQLPEVVYILNYDQKGKLSETFTLLRNKAHTNVSFILGEDKRRVPKEDTSTLMEGIVGSYPNFIFVLDSTQIDDFVRQLKAVDSTKAMQHLAKKYGVRRTESRIWNILDDLHLFRQKHLKLPGLLDMSRYHNL